MKTEQDDCVQESLQLFARNDTEGLITKSSKVIKDILKIIDHRSKENIPGLTALWSILCKKPRRLSSLS